MKEEKDNIAPDVIKKVTNYVNENYKNIKGKTLFITQSKSCFYVKTNKDGSPLIIGKNFDNPVIYK